MDSYLLKTQSFPTLSSSMLSFSKLPCQFPDTRKLPASASATRIFDIPIHFSIHYKHHNPHLLSFLPRKPPSKLPLFSVRFSVSSSSVTPPSSKEDAILQAKTSLLTTLQKPLNNPRLIGKIKKQKQPRFRVEIPVIDDAPETLIQLALDVFRDFEIKRKGLSSLVNILLIWPNKTTMESAIEGFKATPSGFFQHIEMSTVTTVDKRILNSADVAVFLAPTSSQLTVMELVSDSLDPRPLVLFNPKWGFEEEASFGELSSFVGSFDVIYSFLGLEVRGILSKRNGVVFKYVKDGVVRSERWNVFVEEEGNELKVVSRFKTRPSINEVEDVLYNLMAVNSPITRSARFFKGLVSSITGGKTS